MGQLLRSLLIAIAIVLPVQASASETQTYTYDAKGRLVKVDRTGAVNNGTDTDYSYDDANNRTQVATAGSTNGDASVKNLIVLLINGNLVIPVQGPD